MKQMTRIVGSIALLMGSTAVHASAVEDIFGAGQDEMNAQFENLSKDFASMFTYKAASPAGSLAGGIIPVGFDISADLSLTQLPEDSILGNEMPDFLPGAPFPKGHVQLGIAIPFIPFVPAIDVGVQYMQFPGIFNHVGGELKINIAGGNIVLPAVAVRLAGSSTSLTFDDKDIASMMTYGAELTVSKGFGIGLKITPYAGVGYHLYSASSGLTRLDLAGEAIDQAILDQYAANFPDANASLLDDVSGGHFKWFLGANLKIVAFNLGYEMDQTGDALTHTAKLGFVF